LPKIEAEKSLPLRPIVICTPRRSEATNPVMMSVPVKSSGTSASRLARDSCQRMAGPSGSHSAISTRRASIHSTGPARCARSSKNFWNSRVDHSSPKPATRSLTSRAAARVSFTACSTASRARQSRSKPSR
jgi:hypothetical protein